MLKNVTQPSGLLKAAFNSPRWFYRHGFGWMLGRRVLALTHRGRRSGELHETVLEVVHYDKETQESLVGSAYGTSADWFRNIQEEPALKVRTGRQEYVPEQRFLTPEEGLDVARRFCGEHPLEAKLINKVLPAIGSIVPKDTEADPADLLAMLPMVGFRPKT